jgi:hypothetical protein
MMGKSSSLPLFGGGEEAGNSAFPPAVGEG